MNYGREIKKKIEGRRPDIGKFRGWGNSGAFFELQGGGVVGGVAVPYNPDITEGTWQTLIQVGTDWIAAGEAVSSPQDPDDIPYGSTTLG